MTRWIAAAFVGSLCGCFNGLLITPTRVGGPLEETLITESKGWACRHKVAVIDVDGVLLNVRSTGLFGDGENPVSLFRERLDAAAADPCVKAVVLRINSPGGAVTASDIMYRDLVRFRAETGKPVVACLMDVAASGGYYLAMACDRVYAHPSTVTGSIGVIMSLYNAHGLFTKLGVSSDPIKSGPNKDLGNPGRVMTEEERAILQAMVDSFYEQFVQVVAQGRNMPLERVRPLADGRVYTGLDAQRLGLVDEVGYLEDALAAAKAMAGISDARVIGFDRGEGYRGSVYAGLPHIPQQIHVKLDVPGLPRQTEAMFMYLWEPGGMR